MVLYHGSTDKFDEFKIMPFHKSGSDMGYGIYLTDDPERATRYSIDGKTGKGFVYELDLKQQAANSKHILSADYVTLTDAEVGNLVSGIATQQIKDDGYPYILSDWQEPSSDTEMDEGNRMLAREIGVNLKASANDDLDIINSIGNESGGNDSAAATLNPILEQMGIHYGVRDFQDEEGKMSKEYVVFNPKDIEIKKIQQMQQVDDRTIEVDKDAKKATLYQSSNAEPDYSLIDGLNPNQREFIRSGIEGTQDYTKYSAILKPEEKFEARAAMIKSAETGGNQVQLAKHIKVQRQKEIQQSLKKVHSQQYQQPEHSR